MWPEEQAWALAPGVAILVALLAGAGYWIVRLRQRGKASRPARRALSRSRAKRAKRRAR